MWPVRLFHSLVCCVVFGLLGGCATPYRPPAVVRTSAAFPGIAGIVAQAGRQPVDVLVVHGMCTRDIAWAERRIDRIAGIVDDHAPPPSRALATPPNGIEVVERTRTLAGGTVRFHALVWSPLTAPLKRQLDFDATGTPTDCTRDAECKPQRARLNGYVKDTLLNDCLSDVLVYEGAAHAAIRSAMVDTVARVMEADPDTGTDAGAAPTLVVVAESLGSKILFDALSSMLESSQPHTRALGQRAARRLGLLFMAGNQLPILGLAEQPAAATALPAQDALQRFLTLRRSGTERRSDTLARLAVVAFSDPNDLLSYRLLPARYAADDVAVADVLVSNARTWLGLIENPVAAHLDYLMNPDLGALIACGWPQVAGCR